MHCRRSINRYHACKSSRRGLLFIGAFREISLIALVVGLVLMAIREASSLYRVHTASNSPDVATATFDPIMNLDFDRDRYTLVAHTYPEGVDEIRLSNSVSTKRVSPKNLFSSATSEHNSITIMLAQWTQDQDLYHGIYLLRRDQIVHSEEFVLKQLSTADARISIDGSIAIIVSHSGTVIGWDLSESPPVRWEYQLGRSANTNILSPDGLRLVVSSGDGNPLMYDTRSGEVLLSLPSIGACCRSGAWSSDGQRLAMGDERGTVVVFDTTTGHQVWKDKIDFLFARSIALSADGSMLAVGGFDKKIHLWDLSFSGNGPKRILENSSVVNDLVFTDDKLVSGCLDGTIREWSMTNERPPRLIR